MQCRLSEVLRVDVISFPPASFDCCLRLCKSSSPQDSIGRSHMQCGMPIRSSDWSTLRTSSTDNHLKEAFLVDIYVLYSILTCPISSVLYESPLMLSRVGAIPISKFQEHSQEPHSGTVVGTLKCEQCRRSKQRVIDIMSDCWTLLTCSKCVEGRLPFPQERCQRCADRDLDCSERKKPKAKGQDLSNSDIVQQM